MQAGWGGGGGRIEGACCARKGDKMWWRCRWSVATTTTVFVLGIATTVYSQLEISDLDKPSESYTVIIIYTGYLAGGGCGS